MDDFKSHNTIWGYDSNNKDGDAVEEWALANKLTIIHNSKNTPSFHSAHSRKEYNPVFVSA